MTFAEEQTDKLTILNQSEVPGTDAQRGPVMKLNMTICYKSSDHVIGRLLYLGKSSFDSCF